MARKTPEERAAARRARSRRKRDRRYYARHAPAIRAKRRTSRRATPLGKPVDSYAALMAILAKHRKKIGLSQLAVDFAAGMQDGYTGKLEIGARRGGRNLGKWSIEILLKTLGVKLVVVKDEQPTEIR